METVSISGLLCCSPVHRIILHHRMGGEEVSISLVAPSMTMLIKFRNKFLNSKAGRRLYAEPEPDDDEDDE